MGTPIRLENVVGCFPHVFTPHKAPGSDKEKFSVEAILNPQNPAHVAKAQEIQAAFVAELQGAGKGDMVQYMKSPLKSGDEINREQRDKGKEPRLELAGMWVIRASDSQQPPVIDVNHVPIGPERSAQIFGGCVFDLFVDLYWFNHPLNPGVYCGLKGVKLVNNVGVERLGGGAPSVEEMFGAPPALQQPGSSAGPAPQQPGSSAGPAPGAVPLPPSPQAPLATVGPPTIPVTPATVGPPTTPLSLDDLL